MNSPKTWCGISMPYFFQPILLFIFLILFRVSVKAQEHIEVKIYDKPMQFSLFPGISTNGISTWKYNNKFSLNMFGGLSAGNRILEIGGVTNLNLYGSGGIQIAGLANIVGANAFTNLNKTEKRTAIHEGFEANTHSVQIAGFLNFVLGNVTGFQIAGGINVSGNDFMGLQIAGIGNAVAGHTRGIQLSGLYNISSKSTTGFQISTLYNKTQYGLTGIQIGMFNSARKVYGNKSTPPFNDVTSWQIGLINVSKEMAGVQIGLINFGGSSVGKQIGLINFFSTMPPKRDVKNGTPVGLLNFGSLEPTFRLQANELLLTNLEMSTGNCGNCTFSQSGMPFNAKFKKFNRNSLIVGVNYLENIWGFGYGFKKLLFNKYDMTRNPKNSEYMVSYGFQFVHLNTNYELEERFNLLSKIHFELGKRVRGIHAFGGVSINLFLEKTEQESESYVPHYLRSWKTEILDREGAIWLGGTMGIQF